MQWSAVQKIVRQKARRRGTSSPVIATDETGTVIYWNKAAERLYGWRASEAIGQNIIDLTPAMVSRAKAEEIMLQLLAGKPWSGEFTVRQRDGTALLAHVDDVPVIHAGEVVGIIGISRPVRRPAVHRV